MMQKTSNRSHWLGAPIIDMDRAAFERTVLKRFDLGTERALNYVEKIAERQLGKARTLLPYNAILFALLALTDAKAQMPKLALLGGLLALAACLLTLAIMHKAWGTTADHADALMDFRRCCADCYRRAYLLTFTTGMTAVTTAIVAIPLLRQLGP